MRSALEQEIGRRLRRLRKMRGLTQKALAAKIEGGIDYSYIGKIERGEQLPSLKVLRRIGEALGVPLRFFFQEEEPILLPEEVRRIVRDETRMALLRRLSQVHRDDLPSSARSSTSWSFTVGGGGGRKGRLLRSDGTRFKWPRRIARMEGPRQPSGSGRCWRRSRSSWQRQNLGRGRPRP